MSRSISELQQAIDEKKELVDKSQNDLSALRAQMKARIKVGETTGDSIVDYLILNNEESTYVEELLREFCRLMSEGQGLWFLANWSSERAYAFHSHGQDSMPVQNNIVGVLGDNSSFNIEAFRVHFEVGAISLGMILEDSVSSLKTFKIEDLSDIKMKTANGTFFGGSNSCTRMNLHIGDEEFIKKQIVLIFNKQEIENVLGREIPL